jgi:hypothetical protein
MDRVWRERLVPQIRGPADYLRITVAAKAFWLDSAKPVIKIAAIVAAIIVLAFIRRQKALFT